MLTRLVCGGDWFGILGGTQSRRTETAWLLPLHRETVLCTIMGLDRRRSGPEAIAGCVQTPWITVSAGLHVHHRAELRTEGEGATTERQEEKKLMDCEGAKMEGG